MLSSSLYFQVSMIFVNYYNIAALCRKDKMALLYQIDFVEINEPRFNHINDSSGI